MLGQIGLAALVTAAVIGASGCTTVVDPEARPIPPGLAFDREQVPSDIPQDFALEPDGFVEESFRLVDDSTVEGFEFYIAEANDDRGGLCLIVVRQADGQAQAGCGYPPLGMSGLGFPDTEFQPDVLIDAEREGWVGLGSGVWVAEE